MNIFADNASKYWQAGIAVMPLLANSKAAFLPNWRKITLESVDRSWLTQFPTGNIGLPLGHGTGFVAIDVDTDDEDFQAHLSALIPAPDYKRVGKKGYAAFYRTEGETKSARIHAEDGSMLVEVLGERTQCVLPPSIHPDTGKPYVSNVDLWNVVNDLPTLPTNIGDILREAFGKKKRRGNSSRAKVGLPKVAVIMTWRDILAPSGRGGIVDLNEIQALAQHRNTTYAEPLPDDEVAELVKSAVEDWEGGDGLPFTDYGNAIRLVSRLEGKARFVAEWNCWVVWNGHKWTRDTDGFVMRKAKEVGRALVGEIK